MAGNTLLLEYYAPIEVTAEPKLRISTLVHGYKEAGTVSSRYNKRGRSGMCNVNVACADGDAWRDQIRSVGMLLTRSGTGIDYRC